MCTMRFLVASAAILICASSAAAVDLLTARPYSRFLNPSTAIARNVTPLPTPTAPTISPGDIQGAVSEAEAEASDYAQAANDAAREEQDHVLEMEDRAVYAARDAVYTAEAKLDAENARRAPILAKQYAARIVKVASPIPINSRYIATQQVEPAYVEPAYSKVNFVPAVTTRTILANAAPKFVQTVTPKILPAYAKPNYAVTVEPTSLPAYAEQNYEPAVEPKIPQTYYDQKYETAAEPKILSTYAQQNYEPAVEAKIQQVYGGSTYNEPKYLSDFVGGNDFLRYAEPKFADAYAEPKTVTINAAPKFTAQQYETQYTTPQYDNGNSILQQSLSQTQPQTGVQDLGYRNNIAYTPDDDTYFYRYARNS